MARVFMSYSHVDEALRNELEKHLEVLRRQGVVSIWHDRRIGPGQELHHQIATELQMADIILLLVSADFLSSDYCYEMEMTRAMERHEQGDARVIPVILRPCDWHGTPFGDLKAVPEDGKPVTKHATLDDGLVQVAQAVRQAAQTCGNIAVSQPGQPTTRPHVAATQTSPPTGQTGQGLLRSANLSVPREFTDRERNAFLTHAFEYLVRYFENSLEELQSRNEHVETEFRQIDANRIEAAAYVSGREQSRCGIWISLGGTWGAKGIFFSHAGLGDGNGYNESMSVGDDGFTLHLRPLGFSRPNPQGGGALTFEGAAEYYWTLFVERLR